VTITGTNFNPTAANNIVCFGAVHATVHRHRGHHLPLLNPNPSLYSQLQGVDMNGGIVFTIPLNINVQQVTVSPIHLMKGVYKLI
jgi:hypothetical protein